MLTAGMLVACCVAHLVEAHSELPARWEPLVSPIGAGRFELEDSRVQVWCNAGRFNGVCSDQELAGHFEVVAEFASPLGGGLAISANEGKDLIGAVFGRDPDGHPTVRTIRRQGGRWKPLGAARSGQKHVLNGAYSLPFEESNGRVKLIRNALSDTFHLYYGVSKQFGDKQRHGWIELSPVPDWLAQRGSAGSPTKWRPTLVAETKAGPLECRSLATRYPPISDINDSATGFAATRRSHSWSGFDGDAIVVSFDERFRYSQRDYKFVFWERTNYVPAWRLDDQTLFCYEFVETWDPKGRGCYEPMSDRLNVASRVDIVEDSQVRKVIEWRYELLNPDYEVPGEGHGAQRPEVVERYTCYPDGRIFRHIVYTPKLDSPHRNWNEIGEFIVIAGNQRQPAELLASPGLTVMRDQTESFDFFPARPGPLNNSCDWSVITASTHLQNHADAMAVFANQDASRTASPGNRVRADVSWHNPQYRMSHWPVGIEPYQLDHKTPHGQRRQVTHTSLVSFAAVGDDSWSRGYETDKRGRRFRQWGSLLALSEPRGPGEHAKLISSWLHPGLLDPEASPGVTLMGYNAYSGETSLAIDCSQLRSKDRVQFRWLPGNQTNRLYCPCFRISGFLGRIAAVHCDGLRLTETADFSLDQQEKGQAFVWLYLDTTAPISVSLHLEAF